MARAAVLSSSQKAALSASLESSVVLYVKENKVCICEKKIMYVQEGL